MNLRERTMLVALVAAAAAIRVVAGQPLAGPAARVAADPGAALRDAWTGWTQAGTLGGASAQGVRDLPLALWFWLGGELSVPDGALQAAWAAAVVALAVVGAVRLVRGISAIANPEVSEDSWTPWVAGALYGAGVVVLPALARSPLDGLAAATLPWVVAPLLRPGRLTVAAIAGSAAWVGVAGVGSTWWAATALGAGLLAAGCRARRGGAREAAWWVALAALASVWWVAVAAWERQHARDVAALVPEPTLRAVVVDHFGAGSVLPYAVLVAAGLGPLAVAAVALVVRPRSIDLPMVGGLVAGAVAVVLAWGSGLWRPLVPAPAAGDPVPTPVAAALGWVGLAALLCWVPLVVWLAPRVRAAWRRRALPAGRDAAVVAAGVALVVVAVGGAGAAAVEQREPVPTRALEGEVADWSREAVPGRALVLPAGDPDADALGVALGERAWISRDRLPRSGSAATAALDDLLARLQRGDGGPGAASALRRLGIAHVLLEVGRPGAVDRERPSALVRAALAEAGATRSAVLTGDDEPADAAPALVDPVLVDFGLRTERHQVEVWSLADATDARVDRGRPIEVVGDAGSVSDLAEAGAFTGRAVRLTGEPAADAEGPVVLSDSARRRDVDQRVAVDPYGPDLDADAARLVVPDDAAPVTTAVRRLDGVVAVTASSSSADVHAPGRRDGTDPLAALDANPFTVWQSRAGTGVGQWWEVRLDGPRSLAGGTVQVMRSAFPGYQATRVRLTTDSGSEEREVPADGLLRLDDPQPTERLRVTVLAINGETGAATRVGLTDVTIPGVEATSTLAVAGPDPDVWVLAHRAGSARTCVPAVADADAGTNTDAEVGDAADPLAATVCSPLLSVAGRDSGSLRRIVTSERATDVGARIWVRALGTAQAAQLADELAEPTVVATASSTATADLRTRAQAAADGDPGTAWRPDPGDTAPRLTLSWSRPAEVRGVRLLPPDGGAASRPTLVRVELSTGEEGVDPVAVEGAPDEEGLVAMPPTRATQVRVTVLADSGLISVDAQHGRRSPVPVAVAEAEIVGGPPVEYDADTVHALACGSGPEVTIGNRTLRTQVSVSATQVVAGSALPVELCGSARLPAGESTVAVTAGYVWRPGGALLWRTGTGEAEAAATPASAVPAAYRIGHRLSGRDEVSLGLGETSGERTITVPIPATTGWVARGADGPLAAVTVDGWSQGWVVPDGTDRVVLAYEPAESLRTWSAVGAAAWVVVLLAGSAGRLLSRSRARSRVD